MLQLLGLSITIYNFLSHPLPPHWLLFYFDAFDVIPEVELLKAISK